ncbi:Gfo/Idh/MocA family protein [Mucilaginibacter lacusdianchii]|uniref:Gfo/Idh/MocA family protein n=1 Tax=Mucilaginibacter lacusdianchii TaxID=2684211 RepID=UPI00131E3C58|nr:Gfo/Idh/MocA family oxidoreductase [Mucilaginibacter sp. JXJ CY 39]
MSSPIVTGLLAYGMSGRLFHAPFLTTHPGFKLKAVVERNQKKMAQQYPEVLSYNSIGEILNDDEINLIVVNTPSHLHYEQTKQALLAGKHVLVEKPATATLPQVLELFALAKQVNRRIFVYQNRRWDSGFLSLKEVIESGKLGKLVEVHLRYDRYRLALNAKPFKEDAEIPTSGLVYDLGPHVIDQAIALFGPPLSWHKVTGIHRHGSVVNDYFNIQLSYPHQLKVFLTASLMVAQPQPGFVIHGTTGSYIKDRCDVQEAQLDAGMLPTDVSYGVEPEGSEGQLITIDSNNQKQIEKVPAHKASYMDLFEAVYQTLTTGALYPVTEEQIAWQIEILQAEDNN